MSPKIEPKKSYRIGQDKIPPGSFKMAAKPLSTPLSTEINNSFKYNIFPVIQRYVLHL